MLISLNWLKEFVPLDDAAPAIADRLTMSGFEVEAIQSLGSEWDNVVVGEILTITKHPNADKLSLATVATGDRTYAIVCGAPNIREGQKIPLALEGALLPSGIAIKKTKIRGQVSEGMICSETELGLGTDTSGIMVLPSNAPVGAALADYLQLRDTILDISITPNRPDCMSILGIARELAALYNVSYTIPQTSLIESDEHTSSSIAVQIDTPEQCPRYAARIVRQVTMRPSPLWMQRRLIACGMRPINAIVDVTNYVMLERGQPLHAFDLARISDARIVVRRSRPGEKFVTLDGVERQLPEDALLICDGSEPVAIAGIMGGLQSGVSSETRDVLIESAYFLPRTINHTSRRMNLKTEASQRFEKGIDCDGVISSLNRAAALMQQLAGGKVTAGCVDQYVRTLPPRRPVMVRVSKINRIAGTRLSHTEIASLLQNLHCQVSSENDDSLMVTAPSFRYDLNEPIDFVEEVARISGYNRIPVTLPVIEMQSPQRDTKQLCAEAARDVLHAGGFFETIHYSFTSPELIAALRFPADDPRSQPVALRNPLSQSQSVLRTTLLPELLATIRSNTNNGATSLRLFELGNVFLASSSAPQPREIMMLSGAITGNRHPVTCHEAPSEHDIFDLKGALSMLCTKLHTAPLRMVAGSHELFLHPVMSLSLYLEQELIGAAGLVHPDISEFFEFQKPVYVFELDFNRFSSYAFRQVRFAPFSRQPAIYRDIALLVPENVPTGRLCEAISSFKNNLISDVAVFDIFRGGTLPRGQKSIAIRLKFQSPDRTLTDTEVNTIQQRLLSFLTKETGAALRQ